jgi:hypothetical protein
MAIRFSAFDVLKYVNNAFTLKWEIENIPDGYTERVNVFRSESKDGPWEPLASDITGKEYYHDFNARMRNPEITIYYKLTGYVTDGGTPPDTQDIKASDVAWFRQEPDAVAAEMIRRNNLVLQYYSGFKCMILIRKTWGPKCVACYDDVLGSGTSSKCKECFNTKFLGGFYDPILTYVAFMEAGQERRDLQVLTTAPDVRQFWTTNIPELKKGDVLIDNQNQRWKIEVVKMKTSRMGTTVRQMFNAVKVPPDDVLTHLDVRNIWKFTPKRDYHIWVEKDIS